MLKHSIWRHTSLNVNNSYAGESIEDKLKRVLHSGEPISDGSPLIYTPRKEGVRPEFDIRTDRFEVALDAMDKVNKSKIAKRIQFYKSDEGVGETESTQGTSE